MRINILLVCALAISACCVTATPTSKAKSYYRSFGETVSNIFSSIGNGLSSALCFVSFGKLGCGGAGGSAAPGGPGTACKWATEFGQPKVLDSHPFADGGVTSLLYGLDVADLPKKKGEEYAESMVDEILGIDKKECGQGMCNALKEGDDDKAQYLSCYAEKYKQPLYATGIISKERTMGCEDGCTRFDKFLRDCRVRETSLKSDDWTSTQMDRGHMVPNADANTTPNRMCTFYTTNIFHQTDLRNRYVWAKQEEVLRDVLFGKKNSKVPYDQCHIYNSLVFTLPGIIDDVYQVTTKSGETVNYPYFAYKFVICTKDKNAVINLCFLDNPDPTKKDAAKEGYLESPVGSHLHKCAKEADIALAHCVSLDDPRSINEISECFDAPKLDSMTAKQLMQASNLDYSDVIAAAQSKYTVITDQKISEWAG